MSNVVYAVKVSSSVLIVHILAFCLYDLHWIIRKKQLARRAMASILESKINLSEF